MKKLVHLGLLFLALIIFAPICITVIHSFMGMRELELNIGGILGSSTKPVAISFLPSYPTFKNYKDLLLYSEAFYRMFWTRYLYLSLVPKQPVRVSDSAYASKL